MQSNTPNAEPTHVNIMSTPSNPLRNTKSMVSLAIPSKATMMKLTNMAGSSSEWITLTPTCTMMYASNKPTIR